MKVEQLKTRTALSDSGCWEWTYAIHKVGYGALSNKFGGGYAHRAMWEAAFGEIPTGLYVLHKCDNRKCINPDHLFLGTHLDNIRDMQQKGRQRGGSLPGESNPNHKFSDQQITCILFDINNGMRKCDIERKYKMSERTFYRIARGQRKGGPKNG